MTKIERYEEIEVMVKHPWEGVCYWCGKLFHKGYNFRNKQIGWVEHKNLEHEPKIFCSKECQLIWINHKQVFGDLMP